MEYSDKREINGFVFDNRNMEIGQFYFPVVDPIFSP